MNRPDDELLWLAYRFSAGELSAEEAQGFEARLAVDQTAREALAQVVGLSETVFALEHTAPIAVPMSRHVAKSSAPVPSHIAARNWSHLDWSKRGGWVTAAVAVCVALVMTWQVFRADRYEVARQVAAQPDGGKVTILEAVDDETRMLLAALQDVPAALTTAPLAEVEPEELGEPEFGLVRDDGTNDESLEDQNATPDWLLAAVAESQS